MVAHLLGRKINFYRQPTTLFSDFLTQPLFCLRRKSKLVLWFKRTQKLSLRQLRAHLAPNSIPAEPSREPTAGASNSAALHDIIRDLYAAHHPYAWARAIWANPQEVTTQGPPLALSKQLTGIPSARKGKPDLLSDGHV
ncbi:hypothetical protein PSTT_08294 [Puccinia striiformis]|uniref:Uncharacterized protein n=1 Tax=Puccinia striiformis TaxID=27350 RepID=A0A2S4VD11_9BASI|nr:hypothetical protein PSTT_08294 [Puccinia striiformis]